MYDDVILGCHEVSGCEQDIYAYVHVCMYVYGERERERQRSGSHDTHTTNAHQCIGRITVFLGAPAAAVSVLNSDASSPPPPAPASPLPPLHLADDRL